MAALWSKIVAFFTSIIVWISSLFGLSPKPVEPPVIIPDPTQPTYSEAYELPTFTKGECEGLFYSSGSTVVLRFKDVEEADYNEYLDTLTAADYSVYATNEIEGNSFATLVSDDVTVNLSYFVRTKTMRIIAEERGALYPLTDDAEGSYDTLLTGMKGETVVAAEGMGYVIRLRDGSFIVIDGGMGDPDHVDSNKLMGILDARKPADAEKPVIAAWIFTHLHGDHVGVFNCFSLDHHDDVVIEKFMFNFPNEDLIPDSDSPYMLDDSIYRYTQFKKNLADFYADVPVVKLHSGNRFQVRNAVFDVLYTLDDLFPKTILNGGMNESSLLLRMELEGQTFLWTGDFAFNATDLVLSEYSAIFKSDFLQMAHHGMNGTVGLYSKVDPTYALLPVWEGGLDYMLGQEQNIWIVNSANMKQLIATCCGTWTIRLPYSPVPGTFERIPTNETVYPSYPQLLGE